ncbi:Protein UBASH3A [Orchesella cincta]|uniref:Protein UBASH3A n=1 Tax=Orchesella cincta TaxID=48709 RepID=A0A1D2N539_ORCCI|nr:Protein UBASH3A [Orchesella cincta]
MLSRKIVTVRHGERVDFTFTDKWIETSFDADGNYSRQNLNQPEKVPKRKGYPQTFVYDCPLTEVGCLQARLIGKGLADEKILADGFQVYVSPALRCVETATNLLRGMGLDIPLKIEPCLFEWTQWYVGHMPNWMSIEEFKTAGFNIDDTYQPMISLDDLKEGESIEDYYNRSHELMLHLLEKTGNKDLLLVAHGSSLDTNSRQLVGSAIRTVQEMFGVLRGIPYCGVAVMEQEAASQKWSLSYVPKLHICHASLHDFDARHTLCDDPNPKPPPGADATNDSNSVPKNRHT